MKENGSKAVDCLQMWHHEGEWRQSDALFADVTS